MRRWFLTLGCVSAATALVATLSCRQIAGIQDGPQTHLTTTACGLSYGTAPCASCVNESCCDESRACAADSACAAYGSCLGTCDGDPACWSKCMVDHPNDTADVSALSACMASKCETECKLTCGGFAGRPIPPATAPMCASCLAATPATCAATRACATAPDCDTAVRCTAQCVTPDCRDACEVADGEFPAYSWVPDSGTGGALGAYFRALNGCGAACDGTDWQCVGHVVWPQLTAASTPYAMHFWVSDYASGAADGNADVAVCPFIDDLCTAPYTTGTTDPSGGVTLQFPNVMAAGQTGHGLESYLKISGPNLVPYYYYWGFPLSLTQVYLYTYEENPAELQGLYAEVNVTPDPMRGALTVATYDCQNSTAPGVEVTLSTADANTLGFDTKYNRTTATDASGYIIFTNVPAGPVKITATPPGLGKAASVVNATIHAQASTVVLAFPTP